MAIIKITETVLRDAHQSLIATRMKTEDMVPILETLDEVGYHALEVWGGATFDACLRFLNEDPWERLRTIRKHVKKTKLQMLLRGQNLLGYKHYADDVVEGFVKKAVENGIDIIRIFDALNDLRNISTVLKATKEAGGHAQVAIAYTTSPIHNLKYYLELVREIEKMGADSICIKDMAGILKPYDAYELVKEMKAIIKLPLHLHTHYTSGVASMTYIKAIEAGIDVVDCAISPMALGTSQPPTEPLVATLEGTPYDTGLNLELLNKVAEYFRPLKDKYFKEGLIDPKVLGVDANALIYQVPGGMLSNLISQLKSQNKLEKFEEVLAEVPRVRQELGYPPLVTPLSQMVGTQAVFNVIFGERYKMVPKEIKAYVKGEYGRPAAPISEEIRKKVIGNEAVIVTRPADSIEPQLNILRNEMKEFLEQEEDVLSYALFPQVAKDYFKFRRAKKYLIDENYVDMELKTYPV